MKFKVGLEYVNPHKRITLKRTMRAVESAQRSLSDPGFCVSCGVSADQVESDAQEYLCDACGSHAVYGAEEILQHIA